MKDATEIHNKAFFLYTLSVVPDLLVLGAPFAWMFDHPMEQSLHK